MIVNIFNSLVFLGSNSLHSYKVKKKTPQ